MCYLGQDGDASFVASINPETFLPLVPMTCVALKKTYNRKQEACATKYNHLLENIKRNSQRKKNLIENIW